MSTGAIEDATILRAPSATKKAEQVRDPEMHQTAKGRQWYFGMKAHLKIDGLSSFRPSGPRRQCRRQHGAAAAPPWPGDTGVWRPGRPGPDGGGSAVCAACACLVPSLGGGKSRYRSAVLRPCLPTFLTCLGFLSISFQTALYEFRGITGLQTPTF